jgi:uncharacterized integral membrane protein
MRRRSPKPGRTLQAVTVAVLISGLFTGILVLQNTRQTQVDFLFWSTTLPISAALLLAAVTGGILGFSVAFVRQRQISRSARVENMKEGGRGEDREGEE